LIALDLLIIRFLQRWLEIPGVLYDSALFSATFYSSGFLFPNFGELILNVLTILFIAIYFLRSFHVPKVPDNGIKQYILMTLLSVVFWVIYIFYVQTVESLLFHSSIPLSFAELYQLNVLSYLSFLVLSGLTIAFYFFATVLLAHLFISRKLLLFSLSIFLLCMFIAWVFAANMLLSGPLVFVMPLILAINEMIRVRSSGQPMRVKHFIWPLMFFALLLTVVFYQVNLRKGDQDLQLRAFNLSIESDPVFEFLFSNSQPAIASDTTLRQLLHEQTTTGEVY
jgi:hypothetical protein